MHLYMQPEEEDKQTYFEQILDQLKNELDTRFDKMATMNNKFALFKENHRCDDCIYPEGLKAEIRRLKRDNCFTQEDPLEFCKNTISTAYPI